MRELGEQLVLYSFAAPEPPAAEGRLPAQRGRIIAHDESRRRLISAKYKNYKKAKQQLEDLKAEIAKNRENEEFMRFQFKELDDANLGGRRT